jgi:hypothetical protein
MNRMGNLSVICYSLLVTGQELSAITYPLSGTGIGL